jgi:Tol biopolymer transport system component
VPPGAQLHVVSTVGGDVRQVTQGEGEVNVFPQWSSDGASLYFYRMSPARSFRKIPVEGGTSTEVAPFDFVTQRSAEVDPQGRAVAYTIVENGAPKATVVRDLDSGKEHRLGRTISNPRWSPDSRTIFGFYTDPDPNDIWNRWSIAACPADGGPCRTLTKGLTAIPSADGSRLFFAHDRGAALSMRELWMASIDGSNPRRIGTMGPLPQPDWSYDVSRTSQIVYIRLNASRRELWMAKLN